MAIAKRTIKNVRDIRTHSGAVGQALEPHEVHMRLCVLEMEKARRSKERQSALRRVSSIDERFREIEEEKSDLLNALAEQAGCILHAGRESVHEEAAVGASRGIGGFKLTY
jgi:hypothetical protein